MNKVDILENDILQMYPEVLPELLRDHTTGRNIFWATDDYAELGDGYDFYSEITIDAITGEHEGVIKPRVLKSRENQKGRSKKMAEIFTPVWVCNLQNNLVDNSWFEREGVFNILNLETHTWESTIEPIVFPARKTWRDYVRSTRLEITCGEAPYLASRYNSTTGIFIPLRQRIGMLDRKLRVVSENTKTIEEWLDMAQEAYKNIYGYEWQGDSLLLARENLMITFIEYFKEKFDKKPSIESIQHIAHIISWNIWQMDALKLVVPRSCIDKEIVTEDLFRKKVIEIQPCMGCKKHDHFQHNGIYCKIMNWTSEEPVEFVSLLKNKQNENKY